MGIYIIHTELLNKAGYVLYDSRMTKSTYLWEYVFNVGGNVDPVPHPDLCTTTTGSDGVKRTDPSPAYQVSTDPNNPWCHRIAGDINNEANWNIDVIDSSNPAAGVRLTLLNGDNCGAGGAGTGLQAMDRAVALYFHCEDDPTPLPTSEQVDEMIQCLYIINIKSIYGCPLECQEDFEIVSKDPGFHVCSSHGECGWDRDKKQPACFCDEGWYGPNCAQACNSDYCNQHGFCAFDKGTQKAHCFCEDGYGGPLCELTESPGTNWFPWVLWVLTGGVAVFLWVKYRKAIGAPANPCGASRSRGNYSSMEATAL